MDFRPGSVERLSMDWSEGARPGEEELLGYPNLKHNLLSEAGAGILLQGRDTWLMATLVGSPFPWSPSQADCWEGGKSAFSRSCALCNPERRAICLCPESCCAPSPVSLTPLPGSSSTEEASLVDEGCSHWRRL